MFIKATDKVDFNKLADAIKVPSKSLFSPLLLLCKSDDLGKRKDPRQADDNETNYNDRHQKSIKMQVLSSDKVIEIAEKNNITTIKERIKLIDNTDKIPAKKKYTIEEVEKNILAEKNTIEQAEDMIAASKEKDINKEKKQTSKNITEEAEIIAEKNTIEEAEIIAEKNKPIEIDKDNIDECLMMINSGVKMRGYTFEQIINQSATFVLSQTMQDKNYNGHMGIYFNIFKLMLRLPELNIENNHIYKILINMLESTNSHMKIPEDIKSSIKIMLINAFQWVQLSMISNNIKNKLDLANNINIVIIFWHQLKNIYVYLKYLPISEIDFSKIMLQFLFYLFIDSYVQQNYNNAIEKFSQNMRILLQREDIDLNIPHIPISNFDQLIQSIENKIFNCPRPFIRGCSMSKDNINNMLIDIFKFIFGYYDYKSKESKRVYSRKYYKMVDIITKIRHLIEDIFAHDLHGNNIAKFLNKLFGDKT